MIKKSAILAAFSVCFFFSANAQTDTSHYDLGRISVKKDFTQAITIKGADLERYQFTDLADAINIWLYGTYSNSSTLVYVIDGNIIADVNAYSIYDVEEITLVQSALAQVSGAAPGQQMVLIKLKTNRPGKQGVEAAAQTSVVNMANRDNTQNVKSENQLYEQYHLSGYKNFSNTQLGISADYQHDVYPQLTGNNFDVVDPFHFNRFKLNAWGNSKLWKGSTLSFGINYTPQVNSYAYSSSYEDALTPDAESIYDKSNVSQHLFNSNIKLSSQLAKGLTNTLSVAYSHYNYFERDSLLDNANQGTQALYSEYEKTNGGIRESNLLLRDNLIYDTKLGDFDLEPSLNFSYRRLRDSIGITTLYIDETNFQEQSAYSANQDNFNTWLLTPSVNLAYKDILNLQAGFVSILNSDKDFNYSYSVPRFFPFLSASLNFSKLIKDDSFSLRFFGSFARQNQLLADNYATLSGFEITGPGFISEPILFTGQPTSPIYNNTYATFNPYQEFNNYQAGAVLQLSKNFTFNYNFSVNHYLQVGLLIIPEGPNFSEESADYLNDKTTTNRIGLNYALHTAAFNWNTGLNIAETVLTLTDQDAQANQYNTQYLLGHRWSGGFTNRFTYKKLFAGFDILYQLGERPYYIDEVTSDTPVSQKNSFALQSLYAGTQLKVPGLKYAEVFIDTRNLLQNTSSDITDNRRFVGLGVKVGL